MITKETGEVVVNDVLIDLGQLKTPSHLQNK